MIKGIMSDSPIRFSQSAVVTRETHLADLHDLREGAREDGNWGAAVKAEHLRGLVSGLYVQKLEHSGTVVFNCTPEDLSVL